jgi:hypothetical protein
MLRERLLAEMKRAGDLKKELSDLDEKADVLMASSWRLSGYLVR